jgi:predicted GNAT family acetyltransferase
MMIEVAVSSIANNPVKELAALAAVEVGLNHGGKQFVAEDSDAAIYLVDEGTIISLLVWRGCPEQQSAWIGIAWTMPHYRRRGLYTRLLQSLRSRALAQGFVRIRCGIAFTNHQSRRLHAAFGMKPVFYELPLLVAEEEG